MKTHIFDGVSLVSGLMITGIGLIFLLTEGPSDLVGIIAQLGAWFWPILLVVVGITILIPILMPTKESKAIESEAD